ncbi:protein of unknown function [Taphrina deformans PYCC 5710]|uniref:Uncharacterized protein n=1 Tax=Taphrina deformans (strain PYCC 5710 / ATCC 11124 / CBS 356.35 / IMI 108563 / JCM 9778 / NBRC 8474) TaxID=1097556 RepID=R4X821_TAPDE|nr:protein of unknown function [Taphrina deformans PYCC 5710]|eukprot:CCG81599.1 protein of unknown function [Taphrina deformans PYCC 5710]
MSLPPLNLLLPHNHTFKDEFTDYPLHITSTTPAALLTLILLHHAARRVTSHDELETERHSILINCAGTKEQFGNSLVSEESALSAFVTGRVTSKGKFLYASSKIDLVHVTTLHELRAILFLLSVEPVSRAVDRILQDVPDSQDSSEETDNTGSIHLPILALSGLDSLLRDAGELSAQGLLRTLSSAVDAVERRYNLIIHDSIPIDAELDIVSDASRLPDVVAHRSTTFRKCYARYIACDWLVNGDGAKQGQWQYLDGGGYKVYWQQNDHGETTNSRMERMRQDL